jgi:GNAT superfamily N-acetyltransferase
MRDVMELTAPEALAPHHDLTSFDSGEPLLDGWLKHRARRNESRFSRTYVVCDGARVIGFHTLVAGAVAREDAPASLRRNAPEQIPVAVLARLAVDHRYAGRGIGTDLLGDTFRRIIAASRSIAVAALAVHAKSDTARQFYMKRAPFLEFPLHSRTLFLPIGHIAAGFGPSS